MSTRQDKIQALLKEEISQILQREFADPRLGFVTITDVEVSPDISHAKVFVTIYGNEQEKETNLAVLKHAKNYIRQLLGKRIRIRTVPELDFRIDTSIDHGMKITELLEQIKHGEEE